MSRKPQDRTPRGDGGGTEPPDRAATGAASREDRLKAALKANMARRKAQAKARAAREAGSEDGQE